MVTIPAAFAALCLGLGPAEPTATTPPTATAYEASYPPASAAEPSPARRAALASTLARRRAFKRRMQGNALRQRSTIAPYWSSRIAQVQYSATHFVECTEP